MVWSVESLSYLGTDQTIAIGNILTLSPRTVNETRGQFTYSNLQALPTDPIGPAVNIAGIASFGTLSGSLLPFLLRRLGFDPATSSAPFVATLVDVTGLCIYFSVALLILRGTLL